MTELVRQVPVEALQEAMLAFPQAELQSAHDFHGGMYLRQVMIPAGHTVVGKKHKRPHFFIVATGSLMISHKGEPATRHDAPYIHLSEPGTKRALYALADSLVFTVHATKAKTVKSAAAVMVEPDCSSPFLADNTLRREMLT